MPVKIVTLVQLFLFAVSLGLFVMAAPDVHASAPGTAIRLVGPGDVRRGFLLLRICEQRGALVSGGQGFAVPGTSTPNGLRLALGGEVDPAHTLEGVKIVAEVLASLSLSVN